MTVCELFAGVGGFRLGLKPHWQVAWANQWEPGRKKQHAYECYRAHFDSGIHSNDDIAAVSGADIPEHDLLVGGFPCQDYSVAATQAKGLEGKKGVLWWEIERIVREKQPSYVLLENVDRLLKSPASQRGRDFAILLACFNALGYGVEWRVINSGDYGFPQRRRRAFIAAFRRDTEFFRQLKETYCSPKWLTQEGFFGREFNASSTFNISMCELLPHDIQAISDKFAYRFSNAGAMVDGFVQDCKVEPMVETTATLGSILQEKVDEQYYVPEKDVPLWKKCKDKKAEERTAKSGFTYHYSEGAIPFPDNLDTPSRTMLTSEGNRNPNRCTHVILDPQTERLRRLTPIEVERLNGFPDDWTNTGMPESMRYFCMGNALVVGLISRMGRQLANIAGIADVHDGNLVASATSTAHLVAASAI